MYFTLETVKFATKFSKNINSKMFRFSSQYTSSCFNKSIKLSAQ